MVSYWIGIFYCHSQWLAITPGCAVFSTPGEFVRRRSAGFCFELSHSVFPGRGANRNLAIGGVLLLAVVILVAVGITLVPLIIELLNELANILPSWIDSGTQQLQTFQEWALNQQQIPINFSGLFTQVFHRLSSQLQTFTGQILSFAVDTINVVVNVLLAVVLTIYMILNGDRLWDALISGFPHQLRQKCDNY